MSDKRDERKEDEVEPVVPDEVRSSVVATPPTPTQEEVDKEVEAELVEEEVQSMEDDDQDVEDDEDDDESK